MLVDRGLEGVEVGETAVSLVAGDVGKLKYRGVDIDDLVGRPFAEVARFVVDGRRDDAEFDAALADAGTLTAREAAVIERTPDDAHPMQVLQAMVPILDYGAAAMAPFAELGDAAAGLVAAAKLPQIVAALAHGQHAQPYPDGMEYCRRFLTQLNGCEPTAEAVDAFRITQILQLEHGFNASTFCARVTASTLAPVQNVVSAAIGTLHGRLHGGADQAALEIADEVGSPANAKAFVDRAIADKVKVMGMGHREYKVVDPRAKYGKTLAETLARGTPHEVTFETLAAIEARFEERMGERGKPLHANIEFYKGLVYRILGLTPPLFTCGFAMARVFGYVAHFIESREDNRLIRPGVRYVGP